MAKVNMRILHRYLGFFLAGIMTVYALSGIVLIFRNTEFLKSEITIEKELPKDIEAKEIGEAMHIKKFKITEETPETVYFEGGEFNRTTGMAIYTKKDLPFILQKMTHLHKATTNDPLFYLNIFFGLSLLFFVISAFWMYMPKTTIFKKGMYFALAGVALTLILLFI